MGLRARLRMRRNVSNSTAASLPAAWPPGAGPVQGMVWRTQPTHSVSPQLSWWVCSTK